MVLASHSGRTEDTLEALRFARDRAPRRSRWCATRTPPLRRAATTCSPVRLPGLYCPPLLAVTLFAPNGAQDGNDDASATARGGRRPYPPDGRRLPVRSAIRDASLVERFADSDLLYCLGAGPCSALAYKFGLTVFMENMRISGSVIESAEFRHGPAEMLDRRSADLGCWSAPTSRAR